MKLSLEQNIKYAEQLGFEAFHAGIEAFPAEDKKFLEFTKATSTQTMPSFSYLLAWKRGWQKAKKETTGTGLTEGTIQSYKNFLDEFKEQNPVLIESIHKGFSAIFEGYYQEIIGLGDLKSRQDKVNPEKWDTTQCSIFRNEWNKRYPNYPVAIKANPHDFGTYYDIKMREEIFDKAAEDITTFPKGPEQTASDLADELHLDY